MKRLIITADDFGYSCNRNEGIVECFLKGGITRTSLLVNGVAAKDAYTLALKHGIPIGLHLNLTEGVPVSKTEDVSSLLSSSGTFLGKMGFRNALLQGTVQKNQIVREISSQIEQFKSLCCGSLPSHVDGHQHVHILPDVCEVFAQVLSHYAIEETRLPADLCVKSCDWMTTEKKLFYNSVTSQSLSARNCFIQNNLRFTDCFTGIVTMGSRMTVASIREAVLGSFDSCHVDKGAEGDQLLRGVTCELMVHPGYRCRSVGDGGCGEGADDFSMSSDREHEMSVLCSEELKQFYIQSSIRLTSRVLSS